MILDQIQRKISPQVDPSFREMLVSTTHRGARKLFELFHIPPRTPVMEEPRLIPMPADEALYALERHAIIAKQMSQVEHPADYMAAFEALNANFKRNISGDVIAAEMDQAIAAVESFSADYDQWTGDPAEEGLIQTIKDKHKQFSDRHVNKREFQGAVKKIEVLPFEQIVGMFLEAAITDPAFDRTKKGIDKIKEAYAPNNTDLDIKKYQDLYYMIDGRYLVVPLVQADKEFISALTPHEMAQYIVSYRQSQAQIVSEPASEGFLDLFKRSPSVKDMVKNNTLQAEVNGVRIHIHNDNMREISGDLVKKMDKAISMANGAKKELSVCLFRDYGDGGKLNLTGHLEAAGVKSPKDIEKALKLVAVKIYVCDPTDVIKETFVTIDYCFTCDVIDHDHLFTMERYYDPRTNDVEKDDKFRCEYSCDG